MAEVHAVSACRARRERLIEKDDFTVVQSLESAYQATDEESEQKITSQCVTLRLQEVRRVAVTKLADIRELVARVHSVHDALFMTRTTHWS